MDAGCDGYLAYKNLVSPALQLRELAGIVCVLAKASELDGACQE
jgi:hypothetical protein